MADITTITCAPVVAGGNWFGVIVADQGGQDYSLSEDDHQRVHTLGRLAAVAATVEESITNRERSRSLDSRIGMIREIHEHVVQRLFGISLALGSDGRLTLEEQHRCGEEITGLLGQLRTALARPLAEEPLPEAGDSRSFRELVEWFAESESIELSWQQDLETPSHLDPMARSALIEALRNAEKHSSDGPVEVTVGSAEGAFSIEVVNERAKHGRGDLRSGGGGLGLRLLTLEALQHDALVEFGPVDDDRWRFRMLAPVEPRR